MASATRLFSSTTDRQYVREWNRYLAGYNHFCMTATIMPGRTIHCVTYCDIMSQEFLYSETQGVFPNELKTAMESPIYNAKGPMYFSNYRPISLLSNLSKIFERLTYNRILDFPKKHKILNKYQFGFRTNHTTYMALTILFENLMEPLK